MIRRQRKTKIYCKQVRSIRFVSLLVCLVIRPTNQGSSDGTFPYTVEMSKEEKGQDDSDTDQSRIEDNLHIAKADGNLLTDCKDNALSGRW